ncbi:MAG: right-handed parallel beta-helix repeat-containing protein [Kiritimatiellaeota bacterium]|nr:right-handed parallel beta-helix repeat-containing protein [Kiritimatiellota bacterium]
MSIRGCFFAAGLLAFAASGGGAVIFHVATTGNDAWSGRLPTPAPDRANGPFRTLERARTAVRAVRAAGGAPEAITVRVRPGVYNLSAPLMLGREDGGTPDAPVTWEAAPGGGVLLSGGVPVGKWVPYRDGIFRTSIAGLVPAGHVFHQLFYRGVRQVLAREPNQDPRHPRTGGFVYVNSAGPRPREQFYLDPDLVRRVSGWRDRDQLEVSGMSGKGWTGVCTPVQGLDAKTGLVTVRGIRYRFYRLNRLFFQNALAALDAPGEWFYDVGTGELYFRPPDGDKPEDGAVVVPVLDTVVEVRGSLPYPHQWLNVRFRGGREAARLPADAPPAAPVGNIVLRGFRIEYARQHGVVLVGAENCRVVGCAITNVGGCGINLGATENAYPDVGNPRTAPPRGDRIGVGGAGQDVYAQDPCRDCRIAGNDVWSVGADGIFLYGVGNSAENNHVYNSGLYDKDCAAINVFGEKNTVRQNTLHDVPRNAVFLKGIDNVIESNDIHHTMLETCDGGAIRMCQRNPRLRGNVIRRNRIVDTLGYGYSSADNVYRAPYFSWGVYLDDFTCGTAVTENLIVRVGRAGVHIHGGSDNTVAGNIIVDPADYCVELNPIREHPAVGNRIERNLLIARAERPVVFKCGKWREGMAVFDWNLMDISGGAPRFILGAKRIEGLDAWRTYGLGIHSRRGRCEFIRAENGVFRFGDPTIAAGLGIRPFPVGEIGCRVSEERRTWPLHSPELPQEKPVQYKAGELPLRDDFEAAGPGDRPFLGSPDIMAPGPSSIRIVRGVAARGERSLRFEDAPGLTHDWLPRIFYPFRWSEGRVRVAFCLRIAAEAPPKLYIDLRQYRDLPLGTGYLSGVMLAVDESGELTVNRDKLVRVPFDTWCRFDLVLNLGGDAGKGVDLRIEVPGRAPATKHFPYAVAEFARLDRLVVAATADRKAVFYLDDIRVGPVAEKQGLQP